MNAVLLPTSYLGPLNYYSKLKRFEHCEIEHFEHLPKQTYRSRCAIYSPNGPLILSIPLIKRNHRQSMKEVKISYDYDWLKLHWRTLESAYRRSPFFEYYEDDLQPFYASKKHDYLVDFNESIQQKILQLLKLKKQYSFTAEYIKTPDDKTDLRELFSEKNPAFNDSNFQVIPYMQVFETKHGFLPNLSIVDLLFNTGSKALDYI
ncbi:MAG TPA: WbqC family protein [Bacteroidia bacterium]|nr:WbqC family protein [Bacteroidia bacterium]